MARSSNCSHSAAQPPIMGRYGPSRRFPQAGRAPRRRDRSGRCSTSTASSTSSHRNGVVILSHRHGQPERSPQLSTAQLDPIGIAVEDMAHSLGFDRRP
jgi:hypothetical protein